MNNFLDQYGLYNLVRIGTCFKNSSKPTTIDVFLTTKTTHFWNTAAVCSGLSEFDKSVLMVLKNHLAKTNPVNTETTNNYLWIFKIRSTEYFIYSTRKTIIRRSQLENIYFKKQNNETLQTYRKQKNCYSKLYKKESKKFFYNLSTSVVPNKKTFWIAIEPFFTYKMTFE